MRTVWRYAPQLARPLASFLSPRLFKPNGGAVVTWESNLLLGIFLPLPVATLFAKPLLETRGRDRW